MSQTFAEMKNGADNTALIRKVLEAVCFLAPIDAPIIDTLTDASGALQPLPEGYLPVGIVTPEGYQFSSDVTTAEVEGFGYANNVREDIIRAVRGISFTTLEYKANVLSLAYGMDVSTVQQAVNGEIVIDLPPLPEKKFYRGIVIGRDGSGENEIFIAKHVPRVYSVNIPEEVWSADPISFAIDLTLEFDKEAGTDQRNFIAGPGAKTLGAAMGFTQAGA